MPIEKSFVVLSTHGKTVASLENPPLQMQGDLARDENDGIEKAGSNRRNMLWECFSSNAFKSKREKSQQLTAQLKHEEISSSNSSLWSNASAKVPYAQVTSSQSSTLPPPQFYRARLERHEGNLSSTSDTSGGHPWSQSIPPLNSSLRVNHPASDSYYNFTSGSNELAKPPSEEKLIRSSGLREFTAELKYLSADLVEYGKAKTWKKKLLTVLLCVISMLVFYDLLFGKQDYIITFLHSFIVWMTTHHTAAVFAFVGIFVVSTLAFVPPTLLVFGAGYAFTMAMDNVLTGVIAAALSCFLGSCIGAIIAFLRSRYMMRDLVQLFANRYPLVRKIDQALKVNHGFWIMLLLRLSPIIPFNGLNYCCGITGVTLHDFTLSLVGILPFQVYMTILGATAGAIEMRNLKNDEYTPTEKYALIGFIITGVIFGIIAIVYVWRLVKHELRRELSLSAEEFDFVIQSDRGSSSFSFHLREGNASFHNGMEMTGSNEDSISFQEEGEEWFWIWA